MGTWTAATVDHEHSEILEQLQGELNADSRVSYGSAVSLEVGGDQYERLKQELSDRLPNSDGERPPRATIIVSNNTNEDGHGCVITATGEEVASHTGESGPRGYDVKEVLWARCSFEPAVAHKHPDDAGRY